MGFISLFKWVMEKARKDAAENAAYFNLELFLFLSAIECLSNLTSNYLYTTLDQILDRIQRGDAFEDRI